MSKDVRRTIAESKKKIRGVTKNQAGPERDVKTPTRNSPTGRRIAEMRARRERGE